MDEVQYEGLLGIASEQNKKLDAILAISKVKENQPANQVSIPTVSKEEIDAIVKDKVTTVANYIELRIKQQTENQTKILTTAINEVDKKIDNLLTSTNGSFPQPKKIAFFGFEFLRTSVVIFILSVALFWSLVMNIKQIDNNKDLKTQLYQQREYIFQMQQTKKIESKKVK